MKNFFFLSVLLMQSCQSVVKGDSSSLDEEKSPKYNELMIPADKPYEFKSDVEEVRKGLKLGLIKEGREYCRLATAFVKGVGDKLDSLPKNVKFEIQLISNLCFEDDYKIFGEKQHINHENEKFIVNLDLLARNFETLANLAIEYHFKVGDVDHTDVQLGWADFREKRDHFYLGEYVRIINSLNPGVAEKILEWRITLLNFYGENSRYKS